VSQSILDIILAILGGIKPNTPTIEPARTSAKYPVTVLLDAGHGLTRLGSGDWNYQRDEWYGVLEDLAVQSIALGTHRNLIECKKVLLTRPLPGSTDGESPGVSGNPRWKEAAVYWLRSVLDGHPQAHGVTEVASSGTDRDKDINCRPRYANLEGADYLISLHVNAQEVKRNKPLDARGVTVYYKYGCQKSKDLAAKLYDVLKDHPFHGDLDPQKRGCRDGQEFTRKKGIMRDCACPVVIVEFLFYTNKDDAAILADESNLIWAGQRIAAGLKLHLDTEG